MYQIDQTMNWWKITHTSPSQIINSSPPSAAYMRVSIVSDNGLLPIQRQAIIKINAEILLIGPLGTNFSEILINFQENALVCKMVAILSRPQGVKHYVHSSMRPYQTNMPALGPLFGDWLCYNETVKRDLGPIQYKDVLSV